MTIILLIYLFRVSARKAISSGFRRVALWWHTTKPSPPLTPSDFRTIDLLWIRMFKIFKRQSTVKPNVWKSKTKSRSNSKTKPQGVTFRNVFFKQTQATPQGQASAESPKDLGYLTASRVRWSITGGESGVGIWDANSKCQSMFSHPKGPNTS